MQTCRIVDRPFDPFGQILCDGPGFAGVGVLMEGSGNIRRIVGGEQGRQPRLILNQAREAAENRDMTVGTGSDADDEMGALASYGLVLSELRRVGKAAG